jgi:hypothetical protein
MCSKKNWPWQPHVAFYVLQMFLACSKFIVAIFFYPFFNATSIVKLHAKVTRSERLGTVTRTEEKRDIPPFCQLMGYDSFPG